MTEQELLRIRADHPREVKEVIDHLLMTRNEMRIIADFGLGLALCHRDFTSTREAIKEEQEKLSRLADGELPSGINWGNFQRGEA